MPAIKPQHEHGFTLVELLIAISLLGLISVVTYSAIWTANRSLQRVVAKVEENAELRAAEGFLRQYLMQARAVMAVERDLMQVVFKGGRDVLSFVAPSPRQGSNVGGLYIYRIELAKKDTYMQNLRLSYWLYFPKMDSEKEPDALGEVMLMDNVDTLSFSFYGRPGINMPEQWVNEWHRTDILPQLVRMEIQKFGGGEVASVTVEIRGQTG